jgi:peptidoglycan hydrolase-like protein with peptidoglycan-binding domain
MSRALALIASILLGATPFAGPASAVGAPDRISLAQAPPAVVERTKEIQRGLKRRGYDPGPIDGLLGLRTARAIRRFQADNGLYVNGMPTRTVYEMLAGEANGS